MRVVWQSDAPRDSSRADRAPSDPAARDVGIGRGAKSLASGAPFRDGAAMERSTAILVGLAAYFAALLALGFAAKRRTHDAADFYLGGKTLGPWVGALSANASSSTAWSLVGVSGFAYLHGLAALWLIPGCVGGFVLNYWFVAPRLRARTGAALTLTEFLAGEPGRPGRRAVVVAAALLCLFSLTLYVASQIQAAGLAFGHAFATSQALGAVLGAAVTLTYTLAGGYLASSITNTVQGLQMVGVAIVVPVAAVVHLGGVGGFLDAVARVDQPGFLGPSASYGGAAAVAFVLGLCGIGLGYPGQPHAVNKFMGMAPGASMAVARAVGIGWAVLLYAGMIVLGLAARASWAMPAGEHENVLYEASQRLLPAALDAIVLASAIAAIMSTVDAHLLVCASSLTHDLGVARRLPGRELALARGTVLAIGVLATVAALVLTANVFRNVLFAWGALGSAFGPLLLVRLARGDVAPRWALASIVTGGAGAIAGFFWPVLAPRFADLVLSWVAAFALAWIGQRRARERSR
jgi:Na+/proline symporter